MESDKAWAVFLKSGLVSDYLRYIDILIREKGE